jgi:mono/diheme cytochrome c family protein
MIHLTGSAPDMKTKLWLGLTLSLAALGAARAQDTKPAPGTPDPALISHGEYLTTAGDCAACHTAPGGQKFAGGLYMDTPFGPISTPNITPDKETGIGNITDDQFYRVFHAGIGMKGEPLYPVMPYPWYTKVTRDDVLAIKAYLFSLAPVHAPRKPLKLVFPFNVRDGLYAWQAAFFVEGTFKPDPKLSPQENRGAYLVEGLEHCGECHNGNNLLGDTKWSARLRGGPIDNWYAPNISSDKQEGIGKYSDEQIFQYLKTGAAPGMGVVAGPMAQTVHESLRHLTDDDLHDIVLYLKTTPPKEGYKPEKIAPNSDKMVVDAQSYLNYCASCHGQDGKGLRGSVPALAGNGAVTAQGPETVIRVVLGGINAKDSYSPMPAIGARMSDVDVANAVNYIRASWGNAAPAHAGPGLVGELRADTKTVLAMNDSRGCPPVADPDLAKVIGGEEAQATLKATNLGNVLQNSEKLIGLVRQGAPKAQQADIINALTLGYCPVVAADKSRPTQAQKSELLDEFAERVYTQLVSNGRD